MTDWIKASQEECILNSNNSLSLKEIHGTKNKATAQNVTNIKSNVCFLLQVQYKYLFSTANRYLSYVSIITSSGGNNTQVGRIWNFFLFVIDKRSERGYLSDNHLSQTK